MVLPLTEREWRKLIGMLATITDFNMDSFVSKERVRLSMILGLPDSLRGEIWCLLCNVEKQKANHGDGIYWKLADLENPEMEGVI